MKECGALLSKLSEMFVEEISLKSWFMKARDSEERQNLTVRNPINDKIIKLIFN